MKASKDQMTVLERNSAYFSGQEVDRLPCAIMFEETAAVYAGINVEEYYFNSDKMLEAEKYKVRMFGAESAGINVTLRGLGEAVGSKMGYKDDGASYLIEPAIKDYKALEHMDIVDPYRDGRLPIIIDALGKIKKELGKEVGVGSGISGPISAASAIRGTENLVRDIIRDKDNVHRLLEYVTACNLEYVKAVYETHGIVCGIGDPVSCGNLISLRQFEEFSEPYLEKTIDGIYEITGKKPYLHICGKTSHIWHKLKAMNISTFSVDNCEDMGDAKKALGDKVCLVGNVDPVSIVRNGSVEDVHEAVKSCIEKAADSPNGYIVGTGCDIPSGAPVENILAMADAVRRYGGNIAMGRCAAG